MKDWIYSTNVYEVNLRQYTHEGTINAFAHSLPRLRDMGVETLWFMPITPIAQKNKKGSMGSYYACSDYTAVDPEFGTLEDFRKLVKDAQAMGFKVILDWVANHTGWDHRWTWEHPEYYERDEATGDFKKASGMDDIIELDFKNPSLRRAMIEAMSFWIKETGIDGFRCDLAFWVEIDFWIEAKRELDAIKPLFWLGEHDALANPEYMQVFDAAYTWTWMHQAQEYYQQRASFNDLLTVLHKYDAAPGVPAWFTTNHDENSWNGTEYEKYGEMAKALAVFSCTWKGIPLIYSGQEVPNHKRLQFFEKDVIEWKESCELHGFYKVLLILHKNNPALSARAENKIIYASDGVLSYTRTSGEDEVLVILNLTAGETPIDPSTVGNGYYKEVFTGQHYDFPLNNSITVQPWSYLVLEKHPG